MGDRTRGGQNERRKGSGTMEGEDKGGKKERWKGRTCMHMVVLQILAYFLPTAAGFFMLDEVDQWMLHTYIAKIQKLSLHSYHSVLTCIA